MPRREREGFKEYVFPPGQVVEQHPRGRIVPRLQRGKARIALISSRVSAASFARSASGSGMTSRRIVCRTVDAGASPQRTGATSAPPGARFCPASCRVLRVPNPWRSTLAGRLAVVGNAGCLSTYVIVDDEAQRLDLLTLELYGLLGRSVQRRTGYRRLVLDGARGATPGHAP
jgi:hypothetical protein